MSTPCSTRRSMVMGLLPRGSAATSFPANTVTPRARTPNAIPRRRVKALSEREPGRGPSAAPDRIWLANVSTRSRTEFGFVEVGRRCSHLPVTHVHRSDGFMRERFKEMFP
eukprot:scaffold2858_cov659-Pavlova_lutheri.AAC.58